MHSKDSNGEQVRQGGLCCVMAAGKVSAIFISGEGSESFSLNSSPNIAKITTGSIGTLDRLGR